MRAYRNSRFINDDEAFPPLESKATPRTSPQTDEPPLPLDLATAPALMTLPYDPASTVATLAVTSSDGQAKRGATNASAHPRPPPPPRQRQHRHSALVVGTSRIIDSPLFTAAISSSLTSDEISSSHFSSQISSTNHSAAGINITSNSKSSPMQSASDHFRRWNTADSHLLGPLSIESYTSHQLRLLAATIDDCNERYLPNNSGGSLDLSLSAVGLNGEGMVPRPPTAAPSSVEEPFDVLHKSVSQGSSHVERRTSTSRRRSASGSLSVGVGNATSSSSFSVLDGLSGAEDSAQAKASAEETRRLKPMKEQFWRTKMCQWVESGGVCRKGASCRYAHNLAELRPLPDLTRTKLCDTFRLHGSCPKGDDCRFAHSQVNLRATQAFVKTKMCPLWAKGECLAEQSCRFAHGLAELRQPAAQSSSGKATLSKRTSSDSLHRSQRSTNDCGAQSVASTLSKEGASGHSPFGILDSALRRQSNASGHQNQQSQHWEVSSADDITQNHLPDPLRLLQTFAWPCKLSTGQTDVSSRASNSSCERRDTAPNSGLSKPSSWHKGARQNDRSTAWPSGEFESLSKGTVDDNRLLLRPNFLKSSQVLHPSEESLWAAAAAADYSEDGRQVESAAAANYAMQQFPWDTSSSLWRRASTAASTGPSESTAAPDTASAFPEKKSFDAPSVLAALQNTFLPTAVGSGPPKYLLNPMDVQRDITSSGAAAVAAPFSWPSSDAHAIASSTAPAPMSALQQHFNEANFSQQQQQQLVQQLYQSQDPGAHLMPVEMMRAGSGPSSSIQSPLPSGPHCTHCPSAQSSDNPSTMQQQKQQQLIYNALTEQARADDVASSLTHFYPPVSHPQLKPSVGSQTTNTSRPQQQPPVVSLSSPADSPFLPTSFPAFPTAPYGSTALYDALNFNGAEQSQPPIYTPAITPFYLADDGLSCRLNLPNSTPDPASRQSASQSQLSRPLTAPSDFLSLATSDFPQGWAPPSSLCAFPASISPSTDCPSVITPPLPTTATTRINKLHHRASLPSSEVLLSDPQSSHTLSSGPFSSTAAIMTATSNDHSSSNNQIFFGNQQQQTNSSSTNHSFIPRPFPTTSASTTTTLNPDVTVNKIHTTNIEASNTDKSITKLDPPLTASPSFKANVYPPSSPSPAPLDLQLPSLPFSSPILLDPPLSEACCLPSNFFSPVASSSLQVAVTEFPPILSPVSAVARGGFEQPLSSTAGNAYLGICYTAAPGQVLRPCKIESEAVETNASANSLTGVSPAISNARKVSWVSTLSQPQSPVNSGVYIGSIQPVALRPTTTNSTRGATSSPSTIVVAAAAAAAANELNRRRSFHALESYHRRCHQINGLYLPNGAPSITADCTSPAACPLTMQYLAPQPQLDPRLLRHRQLRSQGLHYQRDQYETSVVPSLEQQSLQQIESAIGSNSSTLAPDQEKGVAGRKRRGASDGRLDLNRTNHIGGSLPQATSQQQQLHPDGSKEGVRLTGITRGVTPATDDTPKDDYSMKDHGDANVNQADNTEGTSSEQQQKLSELPWEILPSRGRRRSPSITTQHLKALETPMNSTHTTSSVEGHDMRLLLLQQQHENQQRQLLTSVYNAGEGGYYRDADDITNTEHDGSIDRPPPRRNSVLMLSSPFEPHLDFRLSTGGMQDILSSKPTEGTRGEKRISLQSDGLECQSKDTSPQPRHSIGGDCTQIDTTATDGMVTTDNSSGGHFLASSSIVYSPRSWLGCQQHQQREPWEGTADEDDDVPEMPVKFDSVTTFASSISEDRYLPSLSASAIADEFDMDVYGTVPIGEESVESPPITALTTTASTSRRSSIASRAAADISLTSSSAFSVGALLTGAVAASADPKEDNGPEIYSAGSKSTLIIEGSGVRASVLSTCKLEVLSNRRSSVISSSKVSDGKVERRRSNVGGDMAGLIDSEEMKSAQSDSDVGGPTLPTSEISLLGEEPASPSSDEITLSPSSDSKAGLLVHSASMPVDGGRGTYVWPHVGNSGDILDSQGSSGSGGDTSSDSVTVITTAAAAVTTAAAAFNVCVIAEVIGRVASDSAPSQQGLSDFDEGGGGVVAAAIVGENGGPKCNNELRKKDFSVSEENFSDGTVEKPPSTNVENKDGHTTKSPISAENDEDNESHGDDVDGGRGSNQMLNGVSLSSSSGFSGDSCVGKSRGQGIAVKLSSGVNDSGGNVGSGDSDGGGGQRHRHQRRGLSASPPVSEPTSAGSASPMSSPGLRLLGTASEADLVGAKPIQYED